MTFRYASESLVLTYRFFVANLNKIFYMPTNVWDQYPSPSILIKIGGVAEINCILSFLMICDVYCLKANSEMILSSSKIVVYLYSETNFICSFLIFF